MFSNTDIANMALSHIGVTRYIEDIDHDNSKEAQVIRRFYDQSRKFALSSNDWTFARKNQVLALLADETDPNWQYVYKMPIDCLEPRRMVQPFLPQYNGIHQAYPGMELNEQVLPDKLKVPYVKGVANDNSTRTILTNIEEAQLQYTANIDNINLFSSPFVDVLAYRLAMYICVPLTATPQLLQTLEANYSMIISSAAAQDSQGQHEPSWPTPEQINLRIS